MSFQSKDDKILATVKYGWINTHEQFDFANVFINFTFDGHSPYLVLLNHELQLYALYNETTFEHEQVAEWVRNVVKGFVELNQTRVFVPELKDPLFLWHWIVDSSTLMKNHLKSFYRGIAALRLDALFIMLVLLYPLLSFFLRAVTGPSKKKKKPTIVQSAKWEEIKFKTFKQIIVAGAPGYQLLLLSDGDFTSNPHFEFFEYLPGQFKNENVPLKWYWTNVSLHKEFNNVFLNGEEKSSDINYLVAVHGIQKKYSAIEWEKNKDIAEDEELQQKVYQWLEKLLNFELELKSMTVLGVSDVLNKKT